MQHIDFVNEIWKIPAENMKMRRDHLVPLSKQVIALLRILHNITGDGINVFPHVSKSDRIMSENSVNQALHTLGYKDKQTAHGFRHSASTILHEQGINTQYIELQLAHQDNNSSRASYNHADYLEQRRAMMQYWADCLDLLRADSNAKIPKFNPI